VNNRPCPAFSAGQGHVLPAPLGVVLADDTVLIPDVVVGRREDYADRALVGVPVLAVEVISRSAG
jgi:Uma2 family endonuclease